MRLGRAKVEIIAEEQSSGGVESRACGDLWAVRERDGGNFRCGIRRAASSGCINEACTVRLAAGPLVSLVVSRNRVQAREATVAALWVDADASGSVDREEVERFVLDDAPEAGEHEFAVVLEALREAARKTFDPSDTLAPVAQAFRSVARLTERPFTGDSPHSLPSHTLGVWARQVSNCSRRQGTLFQERLDRNCEGLFRSVFGAWLYLETKR